VLGNLGIFNAKHCRSLYTYYPIRESRMDTWYPPYKYAAEISFVNELLGNIK